MEKFTQDADYNTVAKAAKSLGIDYVGVKKPVLIERVNAKIEAMGDSETATPAQVQETNTEAADQTAQTEEKSGRGRRATGERQPRVKKAKWYEEEGANILYSEGDIVEVHSGEILVGRKAQVVKMSAKKDAVKAILIHAVKGSLQGCLITLDYDKIKMAEDQTQPKDANEAVTEQEVAAGQENDQDQNQVV